MIVRNVVAGATSNAAMLTWSCLGSCLEEPKQSAKSIIVVTFIHINTYTAASTTVYVSVEKSGLAEVLGRR